MSVLVREGAVRLRVVPNPKVMRGRRIIDWEFRWRDGAGRRRRLKRARRKDAVAEARRIAKELAAGRSAELSAADVASNNAARNNLFGCGVTLEVGTSEYAEARRRLAGRGTLLEAVDFYVRHYPTESKKPIAEVIDELIAARKAAGAGVRHIDDLTSRGNRIKRDLNIPIGDLRAPVLNRWLAGITGAQRTRLNFWRVLSNLVNFAKGMEYLPRSFDEMFYVKAPRVDGCEIEIFTPQELRLILHHVRESARPAILLGAFAGLRTSETLKIRWEHVRWQRQAIQVPANTKTGPRNVPLLENLRWWLEELAPIPCRGPIVRVGLSGVVSAMLAGAQRAGIIWKHNGLRHSFVSYRTTLESNFDEVSAQNGHSVQVLKKNYRRTDIFREDAEDWFRIGPHQLTFFGRLSTVPDRKICPLFAPSTNGHVKIS